MQLQQFATGVILRFCFFSAFNLTELSEPAQGCFFHVGVHERLKCSAFSCLSDIQAHNE